MSRQRGFTLIELLIVLAILAILTGIVAMNIGSIRRMAVERGMRAEREVVEKAIDSFATVDDGQPLPANLGRSAKVTLAPDTFAKYLRRDTKYFYTWGDVGLTTQQLVVWSVAYENICGPVADHVADGVIGCNATACYNTNVDLEGMGLKAVGYPYDMSDPPDGDTSDPGEASFTCTPP